MFESNEAVSNQHISNQYERPKKRGKHKIFIGMAPGVGKTYRMLEEAHSLKQQGIDVVIGLLETHGRVETAEKAQNLEIIPRKEISLQGRWLSEMDTDAIIARNPQLVLVDELAHTNVPGSVYEKRYQDVEKILETGIDVYSTLNIQHLESLNDLVLKISGVVVRERIPDSVLEAADEIIVVDVTPETLQVRLQEGKIYAPAKIDKSLQNFFKKSNLIALRELALREIADNIEEEKIEENNLNYCNIQERILVCVSTYPNTIQLLRRGARIANFMNAKLYILFVNNTGRFLSRQETLHVETCQRLSEEFGGEFLQVNSSNLLKAIIDVAKKERITQIVIGETRRSRWEIFFKGSIVQNLMEALSNVDLHIIAT